MLLAVIAIVSGISALIYAQELPKYQVKVNAVNLLATVRDRDGHLVGNLSKEDFILEEDGQPQEISYFTRQAELPLKMGLLIDTSGSQRKLIEEERSASFKFIEQVLRPDHDQLFIIQFADEAELLQDLTNSRSALERALRMLTEPSMIRRPASKPRNSDPPDVSFPQNWPGGIPSGIPGGRRSGGGRQGRPPGEPPGGQRNRLRAGTVLYDAVFLASDEILQNQEGRKAIIAISDGVDRGSKVSEQEAMEAAHHADTLIYSIRYYDSQAYARPFGGEKGQDETAQGKKTLTMLSQETGGRMFEVAKKMTLKDIYDKIQEELRNQYNLGYISSNNNGTAFRHIKLRTKDEKLEVVTRTGYYPKN
jgi:VWFA-related protein